MTRRVQPNPAVDQVLAGAFTADGRYDVWRPRGTTDWLLLNTVDGAGRIGGGTGPDLITGPGDVVIVRPGVPHDYGTVAEAGDGAGSWSLQYVHFHPRPDWLAWLDWPQPLPGVLRVRAEGETRRRIREALEAADTFGRSELRQATMFAVNALEVALLWCSTADPGAGLLDPRVLAAMEEMAGRLAEPITVAGLARRAGLSSSRFAHLFTEQVGISPMRYLERQRMRLAEQLLDLTPRTVGEIARTVGFEDPLYFSARFRAYAGMPPSSYRRRSV
ncbi:MAG: helix-turn-helix domain-containing protein [Microlunatus sp.]